MYRAALASLRVALLALKCIGILRLAGHVVTAGNHLSGITHLHEHLWLVLEQRAVLLGLTLFLAYAHRNRFRATGHHHIGIARANLVCRHCDGLEARGTETIDCGARRLNGELR